MTSRRRRCEILEVDGEPVRLQGNLKTEQQREAFKQLVRTVRQQTEASASVDVDKDPRGAYTAPDHGNP